MEGVPEARHREQARSYISKSRARAAASYGMARGLLAPVQTMASDGVKGFVYAVSRGVRRAGIT
jgi:hypothetical protein